MAQQLYHAKLAAKDAHALALADVCAAADVEILRKNLIRSDIKKGQTHAVTALSRCLTLYGRDTLITALQCITQTADGNAGFKTYQILAFIRTYVIHLLGIYVTILCNFLIF